MTMTNDGFDMTINGIVTVTIDGSHMTVTIIISWPVISLPNSGNKYLPPPSSKLMLYTSSFTVYFRSSLCTW